MTRGGKIAVGLVGGFFAFALFGAIVGPREPEDMMQSFRRTYPHLASAFNLSKDYNYCIVSADNDLERAGVQTAERPAAAVQLCKMFGGNTAAVRTWTPRKED